MAARRCSSTAGQRFGLPPRMRFCPTGGRAYREIDIKEVVVTNSIPLTKRARQCSKIKRAVGRPVTGEGVQSIHEETSVSILLFEEFTDDQPTSSDFFRVRFENGKLFSAPR